MNRAEKEAQEDFMHESAWRFRDVDEMGGTVNIVVYDKKPFRFGCGELLVAGLILGSVIITLLAYFWR